MHRSHEWSPVNGTSVFMEVPHRAPLPSSYLVNTQQEGTICEDLVLGQAWCLELCCL